MPACYRARRTIGDINARLKLRWWVLRQQLQLSIKQFPTKPEQCSIQQEAYWRGVLHLLTSLRGQSRGPAAASAAIASALATSATSGPAAQTLTVGNGPTYGGLGSSGRCDRAAGTGVESLGIGKIPQGTAVGSTYEDEWLRRNAGESLASEYPVVIGETVTVCRGSVRSGCNWRCLRTWSMMAPGDLRMNEREGVAYTEEQCRGCTCNKISTDDP